MNIKNFMVLVVLSFASLQGMHEKYDERTRRHAISLLLFSKENTVKVEIEKNVYGVASKKDKLQFFIDQQGSNPFCRYTIALTTQQINDLEKKAVILEHAWNVFPLRTMIEIINMYTDLKIPIYASLSFLDFYSYMKQQEIQKNEIIKSIQLYGNFDTDELEKKAVFYLISAQFFCTAFLGALFFVTLAR